MEAALRIALVLERFDSAGGGLETWTEQFAAWLLQRGYEVHIVAFAAATALPVHVHLLPWSRSLLKRAARVTACLRNLQVDLVHDTGTGEQADIFYPQTGARLVNLEKDLAARPRRERGRLLFSPRFQLWRCELKTLEQRQFANAGCIVAVSQMVKDHIVCRYRVRTDTIELIHNGVDTAKFTPQPFSPFRRQWRKRLGLDEEVLFLLVGHNFHLKGVDTVLQAIRLLPAQPPLFHVAIVGRGDINRYAHRARQLGISTFVSFLGWVERVEDLYAAADVSLQPTHYDACSLATLEGLASGLPVITTSANGAAELLTPGVHGFVLPDSKNPSMLAGAMRQLLDPALRVRMSSAARQVAATCDIRENFRSIAQLYQCYLTKQNLSKPQRSQQNQ